jgi:hypothetical protein
MWKCHLISQTRQDGHYFQWDWNIFDSFLSTCTWRLRPIIWPWLKMFDIICRKWMKIATWCDMLMSLPIPSYTSFLSHARPYPMAIKLKCPLNHSWFSLVPSPTCLTATSHFLLVKSQTKIQVNHGEPSLDLDFFGFHPHCFAGFRFPSVRQSMGSAVQKLNALGTKSFSEPVIRHAAEHAFKPHQNREVGRPLKVWGDLFLNPDIDGKWWKHIPLFNGWPMEKHHFFDPFWINRCWLWRFFWFDLEVWWICREGMQFESCEPFFPNVFFRCSLSIWTRSYQI